jgi:hypothetical protein
VSVCIFLDLRFNFHLEFRQQNEIDQPETRIACGGHVFEGMIK